MIRFLCFLFGKHYETCKSCETLKQQLSIVNEEKQRLTDTLISIVKPKTFEAPPIEINQIAQSSALFSRRRAALEAKDREEAKILKNSTNLGKPDDSLRDISIESLEKEFSIIDDQKGA